MLAGSRRLSRHYWGVHRISIIGRAAALAAAVSLLATLSGGCGSSTSAASTGSGVVGAPGSTTTTTPLAPPKPVSTTPVVTSPTGAGRPWRVVATVGGVPVAWAANRSGVTLLRFDQQHTHLALHAGSSEPGGSGWHYGPAIGGSEVHHVIAGFNGGFKLTYGSVGFLSYGRVAAPLSSGLGSIVTYRNGATQIGAWHEGVPATGVPIASVRQNLHLIVDQGLPASNLESCVQSCWGSTLGGGSEVARSALGIDREGNLVWAGGESLSPAQLAHGLVTAHVLRAVELDINPFWVAAYLYRHHPGGPTGIPVVPGQHGILGMLLTPEPRDFFTVLTN
jgi:hypothetical protein